MILVNSLTDGIDLFKSLSSEIRVQILAALEDHGDMNMSELASALHVTQGALTGHIHSLENAGLIRTEMVTLPGHGHQKICHLCENGIQIDVKSGSHLMQSYRRTLSLGSFSKAQISAPCGMAGESGMLGKENDPRLFHSRLAADARILWFSEGSVEYTLPDFSPEESKPERFMATFCLSLMAPYQSVTPGDILFSLNGEEAARWNCPGILEKQGVSVPDFWPENYQQHGTTKMLTVTHKGTYVDGVLASCYTIDRLWQTKGAVTLKIEAGSHAGLTLWDGSIHCYALDGGIRQEAEEPRYSQISS